MEENDKMRTRPGRPITESSDSDFNFLFTPSVIHFKKSPTVVYKSRIQNDRRRSSYYQDRIKKFHSRSIFDKSTRRAKDINNNNKRKLGVVERNALSFAADDKDTTSELEKLERGCDLMKTRSSKVEDIEESKSSLFEAAQTQKEVNMVNYHSQERRKVIFQEHDSINSKGARRIQRQSFIIDELKESKREWSKFSDSESFKNISGDGKATMDSSSKSIDHREIMVNANIYFVGNVAVDYDSAEMAKGRKPIKKLNKMYSETQTEVTTMDFESLLSSDSYGGLQESAGKKKPSKTQPRDFYDVDTDESLSLSRRSSFDHLIASNDYEKLNIERRVLVGPYKFKIVVNESKNDSLYRAIAKAVYNRESEYEQVQKHILNQMEQNYCDYYEELDQSEISEKSSMELGTTNPFQKSYFDQNNQRNPNFSQLHAAASYFGFHCILFHTTKEDTRAVPFFCNDKINEVPPSDVHYYFLRSGNNITSQWHYEFLIPIGDVGHIPQKEIQIKFRNTILAHLTSLSPTRYPLEEECCDYKEEESSPKGYSLLNILRSTLSFRGPRKVIPECSSSTTNQGDNSCPLNKTKEETSSVSVTISINPDNQEESPLLKNNNNINEVDVDSKEDRAKIIAESSTVKLPKHGDKFRVPSNRINIHQLSYHNRLKLDLGLYYRNFMVHRTRTHDLFSLLSEIMFSRLSNAEELRDHVKNDIKKFAYMHIVSKRRRKETLLKKRPNLKHKNYENLFSKSDYGGLDDLESAAHLFKFSYVVIGCDPKYNFYWKEVRPKEANESKPLLVFFLYTYYEEGNSVHKWYYLAEEQISFPVYDIMFGGNTIQRLRKWDNLLYQRPMLSQFTQNFGQRSIWSRVKDQLLGVQNKGPHIMHYVIPVHDPSQAFRLKSDKKTGALIDKIITEHGKKNSQTQRLSSNGAYHLLKVEKHKASTWARLWSLTHDPHEPSIHSWVKEKTSGLWHFLNTYPIVAKASLTGLSTMKSRIAEYIQDFRITHRVDDTRHVVAEPESESEEKAFNFFNMV